MTAPPISTCIVCRNEADRLEPCLESIRWCDDIIFMDLESSDASVDLARRYGAQIVSRSRVPIVEMVRNEIAEHARHDWVLVLDPDERITPGLAAELARVAGRDNVDAVVIPRMNYDLGYPPSNPDERWEPQLRMYRKSRVRWPEIPNALPEVPEQRLHRITRRDELVMVHDRSRNVLEILDRLVRYAPLQAQSMLDHGEVFTARSMVKALSRYTWRQLVRGRAWRDGVPGLLRVGVIVGFHFYVWLAFWQLSGAQRTPEDDRYVRRFGTVLDVVRAAGSMLTLLRRAWLTARRRNPRLTQEPAATPTRSAE